MAANIRDEIRRLHRRKQLTYVFPEGGESSSSHNNRGYSNAALEERMQDSGSDGGNSSGAESPTPLNVSRAERALFTFSQVYFFFFQIVVVRFMFINSVYTFFLGEYDMRTYGS